MTLPGPLSQPEMGTVGLEPRSLTVGSLRLKRWERAFLKFLFLVEKVMEDSSCVSSHFQ